MDGKNLWLGAFSVISGAMVISWCGRLDAVPALFPKVVSVIMIVLGFIGISTQIAALIKSADFRKSFANDVLKTVNWTRELRVLPPFFMAIVYAYYFRKVGFILLTPLLIGLIARYLGYKKIPILIGAGIGFTIILYLLFGYFLNVPIPKSPLGL